jgi:hypothetical protein
MFTLTKLLLLFVFFNLINAQAQVAINASSTALMGSTLFHILYKKLRIPIRILEFQLLRIYDYSTSTEPDYT